MPSYHVQHKRTLAADYGPPILIHADDSMRAAVLYVEDTFGASQKVTQTFYSGTASLFVAHIKLPPTRGITPIQLMVTLAPEGAGELA